jgi:hypothetical protein
MQTPELESIFAGLALPTGPEIGGDILSACVVPDWDQYRIAKDREGNPGLIVTTSQKDEEGLLSPLQLRHVAFFPSLSCRVEEAGGLVREGQFSIVRLRSADADLRRLFLRELCVWMTLLGPAPSVHGLATSVARLAELFQAVTRPGKETVQGLWAELFVIERSVDPELHVRAWHADPSELFDFASGSELLEVKSTTGALRRHRFGLGQLRPPVGSELRIASVMLEEVPSGLTVEDLAEQVKARIAPALKFRVDELVTLTLGEQWRLARKTRFAHAHALASFELFSALSVPTIEVPLPPEISDVRFTADLSSVVPMPVGLATSDSGLFALRLE